tara:strand:+ start:6926 stop:7768 length:843 start_codon:yes stop_codon:yes gene_type:complete
MQVYPTSNSLQQALSKKRKGNSIGFVPTMGALHQGHLSLIEEAKKHNEIVVVSIFVNPTQFDNKEDLKKYPRTLAADKRLLESVNCDVLFAPTAEDIYQNSIESSEFNFDGLEFEMEGKHRRGHFDGVGTIVKRLFEIVEPTNAYFGEKDFQQLQIIKKLVEKYQIPTKIIGCKIYREKDGLAMSSRNTRLTKQYRDAAPFIYQTLKKAQIMFKTESATTVDSWVHKEFIKSKLLNLEYFEIANANTLKTIFHKRKGNKYRGFIAVFAGDVRLIDNIALN